MNELLEAAKDYLRQGLSVIATDNNKRAVFPWKKYQTDLPTEEDLVKQFDHENATGLAIICGGVSGNLEVIDIDSKYDLTGKMYQVLMEEIVEAQLFDLLYIVKTKSGGYHIYYKCECIQGNQKLALRPTTEEERKDNPTDKVRVLTETRGDGGYVIAAPTDGYELMYGKEISIISVDQRETLLTICRSFNEVIEQVAFHHASAGSPTERYSISPWEDYNQRGDVFELLKKHGWKILQQRGERILVRRPGKDEGASGDYHVGLNLFKVFTTSTIFEAGKGYKPAAVYAILECNSDFRLAAKQLIDAGYGERIQSFGDKIEKELFQKKADGCTNDDLKKLLVNKHNKDEKEADHIISSLENQWGPRLCVFWDIDKNKKITINDVKFTAFLNEVGGFGLYFYDTLSTIYRIIRIKDDLVEETSFEQMIKFVMNYIDGLPESFDGGFSPMDLKLAVRRKSNTLYTEVSLAHLASINLDFLRDQKEKAFYPFQNGVVVITKDGVTLDSYKNINKVIWRNQVIPFYISIDQSFKPESCEYYRFIEKISGGDDDRIIYCLTLIGYMLHRFKDPAKPFAMVLAEETESDKDGGGTGKGIFIKALSYLIRTVKIDGKNFKIDKNFSLQRVSLDTQLIVVEDCDKNMDFEKYNSQITEGSTVEKKNKDELFIDYKDSPKFAFTTNYSLNIKGNHGKRRTRVFEFAPFFGPNNTPVDFFKHLLFEDWDPDEWNRFYNLLFFCISIYMVGGIKEVQQSEKLKRKQIKQQFGEEFMEWFDDYSQNGCEAWKPFKELFNGFMVENDFDRKDYSHKRFKKALEVSAEVFSMKAETRRNRQAANIHEFRLLK